MYMGRAPSFTVWDLSSSLSWDLLSTEPATTLPGMGSSVELQSWACWGRYGFDARNLQTLSRQNSGTLREATFSLQVYGRSSSFGTGDRPESLLRGPGFQDLQSGRTRCLSAQAVRCQ